MTEPTQKSVIFLAFAQDRVEGGAYLRNLPIELDGIRPEFRDKKRGRLGCVKSSSAPTPRSKNLGSPSRL